MTRLAGWLEAAMSFAGRRAYAAHIDLAQRRSETGELINHLQARVVALRTATGSLAVFWGRSYVGLRDSFEEGCNLHLRELARLRADLELARQETAGLQGRKLLAAQAHAEALWIQTDELRHEIDEREQFWKAEAEWALSLLGERKPTSWPPQPLREMAEAA